MTTLASTPSVTVRPYDPAVFDELNPFHVARGLGTDGEPSLRALGDVIVGHALHPYMGISLLHKHFSLSPDEVIERTISRDVNSGWMVPAPPSARHVPYVWSVRRNGSGYAFFPLEFVEQESASAYERSFSLATRRAFLNDIAVVLDRLDVLETFGLALRNLEQISVERDELLVEETDEAERLLTLNPLKRADVDGGDLTQTLWVFEPREIAEDTEPESACKGGHCTGHCHKHCNVHCQSHCRGGHKIPLPDAPGPPIVEPERPKGPGPRPIDPSQQPTGT